MPDNLGYTPGTGALVATDDVGGVQFQKIKIDAGGDGVSAPLTFGQALAAASLPVVLASDVTVSVSAASLPLPTGAAADATLTGGTARTRLTDGTNNAAVKAPSTAAVAADPALVVAISPNNTVTLGGTLPNFGTAQSVVPNGSATGGGHTTTYTALSAASTAPVQIKGTAASMGFLMARNNSAATRYVKLFFLPSASVTMGTTSPGFNIGIAAGETRILTPPLGFRSGSGLTWSVTTGQALLDNTAGAAGDVEINVGYV